jgi:erythronate-4-phosphate dehydrogenase
VLLVRSVSTVDAQLIKGSRLGFVGSATAGVNHIDLAALAAAGIEFSDAAGCNARPVAEHVITCLYAHAANLQRAPQQLTVGIIGCGHVGRSLAHLLDLLAIRHVDHDPPRAAIEPSFHSAPRAAALDCEVVTLHVPLIKDGPWPTVNLLNNEAVAALRPGTLLINAARGGVIDEAALSVRLQAPNALVAAIDCWAGEPQVDNHLLRRTWLATPHLAGHSREARLAATRMLWEALRRWRGLAPVAAPVVLPSIDTPLDYPSQGGTVTLLKSLYPIAAHDARMRAGLNMTAAQAAANFDDVRRRYALRREFGAYGVACAGLAPDTVAELTALGFHCV